MVKIVEKVLELLKRSFFIHIQITFTQFHDYKGQHLMYWYISFTESKRRIFFKWSKCLDIFTINSINTTKLFSRLTTVASVVEN